MGKGDSKSILPSESKIKVLEDGKGAGAVNDYADTAEKARSMQDSAVRKITANGAKESNLH